MIKVRSTVMYKLFESGIIKYRQLCGT